MKVLLAVMILIFLFGCCEMPRYLDNKGKIVKTRRINKMSDAGVDAGAGPGFDIPGPEIEGRQAVSPETTAVFNVEEGMAEKPSEYTGGPAPGLTEKGTLDIPWKGPSEVEVPTPTGKDGVTEPPKIIPKKGKEPEPRAWETEAAAKETKIAKKRRRSLLTTEEGGLLSSAPVYRRSIMGS